MDKMIRNTLLGVGIGMILGLIFFWQIGLFGSSSDSDSCSVYCEPYEHQVDALIRTTKENDANCGKYTLFFKNVDKYGREVWENRGYFVLSDPQWEELRKFESAHYFFQVHEDQPKLYPND
jgi:hypothetical protein